MDGLIKHQQTLGHMHTVELFRMRNETGSRACCKMSTQDIEVDDASKSLVASWFSVKKDTGSEANKKTNISPSKSDKKKKKRKVVQSVDTLSSDDETTKIHVPDYSDGRRIDPYSIVKHTTSSFVGQKLDKKLRKAKYVKALQETDDTEKLITTEMRNKKKAKGNNPDEDSEEDSKISMIDKKQANKEREKERVQSYTVEVLEQKLTDSSLSNATKKRLKRKLSKLKAEKASADTNIPQSVTEQVPTGDLKDKKDSGLKKHKKKKKMLDNSSPEKVGSETMEQTQRSGDNDISKLTEKMQKKKAKKHSHELFNFDESLPAKKEGKMSSFDSSSEDEITFMANNKETKHLLETSTTENSFVKIKKKKKHALEKSFEDESSSVKKKGQVSEGEISMKNKSKKHSPEVKSPVSPLKKKKQKEIMDVSFEDESASSEKKGKKRSLKTADEVQISPSKKKKALTDSPSRPDGQSLLLVTSSVIEKLKLKLNSPDIHGKERKKLKKKLQRIRKRSMKKCGGDGDKSVVDEESKTENSPCKKNHQKVEINCPEPKASLIKNVKKLLVGKEKKKKHKKDGSEEMTDPLMSPQVQVNSPEKTAADVNNLKKKKKKKRSKQKNIKKDNRPEHLKPAHLKTEK